MVLLLLHQSSHKKMGQLVHLPHKQSPSPHPTGMLCHDIVVFVFVVIVWLIVILGGRQSEHKDYCIIIAVGLWHASHPSSSLLSP